MSQKNKATVVIAFKSGRLGNRLFQGAHFIGNVLAKGYRLLNPSLGEYAHLFEGSSRDPLCGYPENWGDEEPEFASQYREVLYQGFHLLGLAATLRIVPGATAVDIRRFDEAKQGDINLSGIDFEILLESQKLILPMGWKFSDHAGIRKHKSEIVRYFTPVASVSKRVEALISKARAMGNLLVGVHIRQEDYRQWKNGMHFYETERYVQWMRELCERNSDKSVVFLVCASNILDESLFEGLSLVKGPGDPMGDLHALSLCDKIIGPPSTFSGWASYHGGVPLCVLRDLNASVGPENFVGF
jgi:hypothetical protein